MFIKNLTVLNRPNGAPIYSADLVEKGKTMPVTFSENAGGNGVVAYSEDDMIYPINEVVGKNFDISTWEDGDTIILGIAVPRNN